MQFIEPEVLLRPCHWSQNYSLLSTFTPTLDGPNKFTKVNTRSS